MRTLPTVWPNIIANSIGRSGLRAWGAGAAGTATLSAGVVSGEDGPLAAGAEGCASDGAGAARARITPANRAIPAKRKLQDDRQQTGESFVTQMSSGDTAL